MCILDAPAPVWMVAGMTENTSRAARIEATLTAALSPTRIDVVDESHLHAGHAGARPGGQTHYQLLLVSAAFEGEGRVARHRRINDLLKSEFEGGLHALRMTLKTPAEAAG